MLRCVVDDGAGRGRLGLMARPRGGDFVYSGRAFGALRRDVEAVLASAEGSSRLTGALVDVTDLHGANQRVVDLRCQPMRFAR